MRNIRLTIEYEGTGYAGWQVQRSLSTVQGTIIEAIKKLLGEEVELGGASRTDAGVHALGQVANFFSSTNIPAEGIRRGLNTALPKDIVITEAADVPADFCSRRGSTGKTYLYRLLNRSIQSAIERNFSWHVHNPLDLSLMREAAAFMVGEHDFTSFRASGSDACHSVREVTAISIEERPGGFIDINVEGNAFLRHMIRIMVGTLVEVGKGKKTPDDVAVMIGARDRTAAPMTAPPQGLFLVRVHYPGN
jgi:tRNA pseudouridine38-40 synthase